MTTTGKVRGTLTDAETELARLVREEVARQANPFQLMQVDSVQESGLVNLRWGEAIINDVPANVSYAPRAEGDVVLVLNHAAGWRVIDKIGGPVEIEVPDPIDLEFGPPAPGGDFAQAASVWVQEGRIYVQTGEGPGPGPGDPPKASKPKPVTLDPSSRAAYRSGRRDGSRVAQGAWPTYPHAWTGLWLFGTRIADACAGKTVDTMQIRVARTAKRHGVSGKVRAKLALHDETSAPKTTPSLSNRWDGPGLGMGESKWVTIPSAQAARLASGASRGVAISTGAGRDGYLIATDSCGSIRINFKA